MDNFFENLADILENLPDNPSAIWSLLVLVIGILAFLFFAKAPVWVRLLAFLLCLIGAAGIVYVTIDHEVMEVPTSSTTEHNLENSTNIEVKPVGDLPLEEEVKPDRDIPIEEEAAVVDCNNRDKISFKTWMEKCSKN